MLDSLSSSYIYKWSNKWAPKCRAGYYSMPTRAICTLTVYIGSDSGSGYETLNR